MREEAKKGYAVGEELFINIPCGLVQFRLYEDQAICIDNLNLEGGRVFGVTSGRGLNLMTSLGKLFASEPQERLKDIQRFLSQGHGKITFEYPLTRDDGEVVWVTGVVQCLEKDEDARGIFWYEQASFMDVSASKMALEKAERLEHQMKEERQRNDSFFREVFKRLYDSGEEERGMENALSLIGRYLKADRVSIYEASEEGFCCNTYEWCAEGIEPVQMSRQKLPFRVELANRMLGEDGIRFCRDVGALGVKAHEFLREQGCKSAFLCGIREEESGVIGYVGVESCQGIRDDWEEDEGCREVLRLASQLLASYVSREHNKQHTRMYQRKLQENARTMDVQMSVISALGSVYLGVFACNFKENSIIMASGDERSCLNDRKNHALDRTLEVFIERGVGELYREEIKEFLDPQTLPVRLEKGVMLNHDYQSVRGTWLRLSVFPSGENALIAISHIDDERRQEREYQRKLKEIRQRENIQLKTIMDAIPGGFKIAADDETFSIEYMSPRLIAMLGYSVEEEAEILQRHVATFIHPEDRMMVKESVLQQMKNGNNLYLKYRILKKDGSYFWVEDVGHKIEFSDGESKFYSVILDIDEAEQHAIELKGAYAAIANERGQYRDALTRNALYHYQFDVTEGILNEDIVDTNGVHYLELLGMKPPVSYDEFCYKIHNARKIDFPDGTSEKPVTCAGLIALYESGQTNVESEFRDPMDNTFFRINTLLSKDVITGHVFAFVMCTDVTESRRVEEQAKLALKEAYETADAANRAKTDFLSRMSHDIRTPMNAIIGMTDLAKEYIDDKERVKDSLEKITMSSQHLLGLINDVLDMSKIESGKLQIREESFSIQELIDGMLAMTNSSIEEHHHNLKLSLEGVKHQRVIGDSLRLEQVFINILNNATKYTPDGGEIEISVCEKAGASPECGHYEFSFKDNGIGMTKEFIKVLFEPFSRGEDDRINRIQGTGLGMAIAKNVVRMMNGDIQVESEVGKGTIFTVSLNLKYAEESEADAAGKVSEDKEKESHKDKKKVRFDGKRILVVEDNKLNREIICEILKLRGIQVEEAENGQEGVVQFETHEPGYYDMILMDIQMPVMNGYEATEEIRNHERQDGKTIPIIAMTANAFAEDVEAAKQAGMNEHMAKPIDMRRLIDVFKKYLV
ncbi:MAG: response regulator [Lachnospiraceae bacterium]|nr:response regulator [Lachnospiraceae bacterium]